MSCILYTFGSYKKLEQSALLSTLFSEYRPYLHAESQDKKLADWLYELNCRAYTNRYQDENLDELLIDRTEHGQAEPGFPTSYDESNNFAVVFTILGRIQYQCSDADQTDKRNEKDLRILEWLREAVARKLVERIEVTKNLPRYITHFA